MNLKKNIVVGIRKKKKLYINDLFSKCKQTFTNYMEIFFCSAMVYLEP